MLLKAKRQRRTLDEDSSFDVDATQQDMPGVEDDTAPNMSSDPELAQMTMPMGSRAMTARQLGTDREGVRGRPAASASDATRESRPRRETPRLQHAVRPSLQPPVPPPEIERPVVDEPTFTGPMPGRAPQITPSGSDLSKFLQPGNYTVRVDDCVYVPVSERELVNLLNAGVFFAIDELRHEQEDWVPISSPDLLAELKRRLAHRAHHMLAKVVSPRPAAEFGRPAEPDEDGPGPLVSTTGQVRAITADPTMLETPEDVARMRAEVKAEVEAERAAKKRSPGRFVIPALALTALVGVAAVFAPSLTEHARAVIEPEPPEEVIETVDAGQLAVLSEEDAGDIDPVPTFQSASAAVNSAYAVANSIDGMLVVANDSGDEEAATMLAFEKWKRRPSTVEPVPLAKQLMARKNWEAARQVANWARVAVHDSEDLQALVKTSLREQFESEEPFELDDHFVSVSRVHPGKRPAFVLVDKKGAEWTLWPDLGNGRWKNDIAAYRLCQLMVCHFRIGETREVWVTKEHLERMLAKSGASARETGETLLADFSWSDSRMHGSLRKLPPGAPWPIESSQVWRPWLTAGAGVASLEDNVERAQQKVSFFGADRVFPEISGIRARQIGRQVSSILLFDYLVNNWNRFAPVKENWGSRTYVDDGLIYSVEDSAAFSDADTVRVDGRFSWSKRFSRATIESLRNLDEDLVKEFLFVNPTEKDAEKLERLFEQRNRALRRVDKLVKKYGADDVYAVDVRPKEMNR